MLTSEWTFSWAQCIQTSFTFSSSKNSAQSVTGCNMLPFKFSCWLSNQLLNTLPSHPLPLLMMHFLTKYQLYLELREVVHQFFPPPFRTDVGEGWHLIPHAATTQSFPRLRYKTRGCMTCSRLQHDSIAHSELKTGILLTPPVFSLIK